MTTALAVKQTNVAHLGNRMEIEAVQKRIMSMMPGAKSAPTEVVWAAAQLAVAYRLDPFNGELYIMPVGRKKDENGNWGEDYRTHIGIKGQRKIARRKAEFNLSVREMSPEEVKRFRREDYDPSDIGVEVTVIRLDLARQFKEVGVQYTGSVGRGFWRVKAKFNKQEKVWEKDNIPNTWTAYEVAEKRAEVNALKKAFDMDFDVADPALVEDDDVVETMSVKIANHDRGNAMMAERNNYIVEEDGDILMATDNTTRHRRPQPQPVVVDETDEEHFDVDVQSGGDLLDIDLDDEDGPDFWDAADEPLKEMVLDLQQWQWDPSARLSSDKQMNYSKLCVELVIGKGNFPKFWEYALGEQIDAMPERISIPLFNFLCKLPENKRQKQEDDTWVNVPNPNYSPDAVEMISAVWQYIKANT